MQIPTNTPDGTPGTWAIGAALLSAALFGAAAPLAKTILDHADPWLIAGLLYLGSGLGLTAYRAFRRAPPVRLPAGEWAWFGGAIFSGGVVAPVLLLAGLQNMPASGASLLLNAEGLFTALLAWVVFRENVDRRIVIGMLAIVAGAVVIAWPGSVAFSSLWPSLAVLAACLAWGIDNNLTRKVSLNDATWIASVKGLVAGAVNLVLALAMGSTLPDLSVVAGAMALGLLAYGVSLTLFVVGLRHLGTARTGAYFSIAPFFGAGLAVAMGEPLTWPLLIAGVLMGIGLWLHLTERHAHTHSHEETEHEHEHVHDAHHQHEHGQDIAPGVRHTHRHHHAPMTHAHAHYPDMHHQHSH